MTDPLRDALTRALQAVEWILDGAGDLYCPLCQCFISSGHDEGCLVGSALRAALAAGGPTLDGGELLPCPFLWREARRDEGAP